MKTKRENIMLLKKKNNFHKKFETMMLKLELYVENFINKYNINNINYEYHNNIFTIKCEKTKEILIITRQISIEQIWIATKKKGYYFKYLKKKKKWICTKSKKDIKKLLQKFFLITTKKKFLIKF